MWLYAYASSIYHWCKFNIEFGKPVSGTILVAFLHILTGAVQYTLGRGNRFTTLLVLLLWSALESVRKAMV